MRRYKKYFLHVLQKCYPEKSALLIKEIDSTFSRVQADIQFARTSKNPIDRRMELAGYFLSLVMTLHKAGEHPETIRKICLDIAHDYVMPENKIQAWLKKLPVKLLRSPIAPPLLKWFGKSVNKKGHPDGFVAKIITDKKETFNLGYGVDILECGICKLFKKHQLEQYSSILCDVDHITSGLAGLKLIRSGTLADGAKKCDFRFMINSSAQ